MELDFAINYKLRRLAAAAAAAGGGGEGCFLSSSGQPSGNRNPVDGGVGEGQQAPAAAARSAAVDHDGHYVDGLTEASRGVVTSSVM